MLKIVWANWKGCKKEYGFLHFGNGRVDYLPRGCSSASSSSFPACSFSRPSGVQYINQAKARPIFTRLSSCFSQRPFHLILSKMSSIKGGGKQFFYVFFGNCLRRWSRKVDNIRKTIIEAFASCFIFTISYRMVCRMMNTIKHFQLSFDVFMAESCAQELHQKIM